MRNKSIDILVNYRWILACFLLIATAVLACFVGGVTRDPSMRSGIDTTSRAYHQYQDFMDHFGNEEVILIVLNQGLNFGKEKEKDVNQMCFEGTESYVGCAWILS